MNKLSLVYIFFFIYLSNSYGQMDMLTFEGTPPNKENSTLETDTNAINSLISEIKNDNEMVKKLEVLKEKIVQSDNIRQLRKAIKCHFKDNEVIKKELEKILNEKLGGDPNAMVISSTLGVNTGGDAGGNVLAPTVSGNFKFRNDINKSKKFFCGYDVNLNINSNLNGEDSTAVLSRILRSGADGNLKVEPKIGFKSNKFRMLFALNGMLSWLGAKQITDTSQTPNFGYGSFGISVAIWLAPVVLAIQREWNFTNNDATNFYSAELNESFSTNILLGLLIDKNYQIEFNYLLGTNKNFKISQNLVIKLGANFDLF